MQVDLSPAATNCHNRLIPLSDHLYILGIGGSCIATDDGGNEVWKAYPSSKEIGLDQAYQNATQLTKEDSVILFTHCPASVVSSSQSQKSFDSPRIYTGSRQLASFLHSLLKMVSQLDIIINV